jgi:hypothetical protein
MSELEKSPLTRKEAMDLCGFTQVDDLADFLGLSPSAPSKWPDNLVPDRHHAAIRGFARMRKSGDTLLFEPARLNVTTEDFRTAMQTNQLEALARIIEATIGARRPGEDLAAALTPIRPPTGGSHER